MPGPAMSDDAGLDTQRETAGAGRRGALAQRGHCKAAAKQCGGKKEV